MPAPHVVWFRGDLRPADQPILRIAAADTDTALAVSVLDDTGLEADALSATWHHGRTGYPIVDAGTRQLVAEVDLFGPHGSGYPAPIVDHGHERREALARYGAMRDQS